MGSFVHASPDDPRQVEQIVAIREAARRLDDPEAFGTNAAEHVGWMRYGWDMEPSETYLYFDEPDHDPVGMLIIEKPKRDNRQLVYSDPIVHPDHRRRGIGTAMMNEVKRQAVSADRTLLWVDAGNDDGGAKAFLQGLGFHAASQDARRHQSLADLDWAAIDELALVAAPLAADYSFDRVQPPLDHETLTALVEVTAAINDAPMGELTFEDQVFDLDRIRDAQVAEIGRGSRSYRILARHRATGEVAGHSELGVEQSLPEYGHQRDTAVARSHRGHRLGLLLKIEMLRWLAEVEPQLLAIETWNNAGNDPMVSVNKTLGYRLSRTFDTYERSLSGKPSRNPTG